MRSWYLSRNSVLFESQVLVSLRDQCPMGLLGGLLSSGLANRAKNICLLFQ